MLAAGLAIAAVFAQGGRISGRFDVLSHFAPVYLVAAALLLPTMFAIRGHRRMVFFGLLAITICSALELLSGELMTPDLAPAPLPVGRQVKLIQINMNGDGVQNRSAVEWLSVEDPDFLIIQDLPPLLHQAIARRHPDYYIACVRACDVALISKLMPVSVAAISGGRYGLTPSTIVAQFKVDDRQISVAATHLARPGLWGPNSKTTSIEVQAENAARLRAALPLRDPSLILAGDFNSTPWSFARRREEAALGLKRRTRFIFSWPVNPTQIAVLPIDHIYAGEVWRTVDVRRGPDVGSDHYPIVAVLALAPAVTLN